MKAVLTSLRARRLLRRDAGNDLRRDGYHRGRRRMHPGASVSRELGGSRCEPPGSPFRLTAGVIIELPPLVELPTIGCSVKGIGDRRPTPGKSAS
jgi:hypothetical protein